MFVTFGINSLIFINNQSAAFLYSGIERGLTCRPIGVIAKQRRFGTISLSASI